MGMISFFAQTVSDHISVFVSDAYTDGWTEAIQKEGAFAGTAPRCT